MRRTRWAWVWSKRVKTTAWKAGSSLRRSTRSCSSVANLVRSLRGRYSVVNVGGALGLASFSALLGFTGTCTASCSRRKVLAASGYEPVACGFVSEKLGKGSRELSCM
jgi:hypothetical protein